MKFKKTTLPYLLLLVGIVVFSVFSEKIIQTTTQHTMVYSIKNKKTTIYTNENYIANQNNQIKNIRIAIGHVNCRKHSR